MFGGLYATNATAGWDKNTLLLIDMFKANKGVKETGQNKFKVNGQPMTKKYFDTEKNYYIYLNKVNGSPIPTDNETAENAQKITNYLNQKYDEIKSKSQVYYNGFPVKKNHRFKPKRHRRAQNFAKKVELHSNLP